MNRVLITGGAGFIGSNFTHYWLDQHSHDLVIVLDTLTYAGNLTNLKGLEKLSNFVFVNGDIGDENLINNLFHQYQFNLLINFAAETHVDRSIKGSDIFIETNIVGTHNLLKVAKAFWLDDPNFRNPQHRFHHISTDEVYGTLNPDDPPFVEELAFSPNSPYAASKASADHLVRAFNHTYNLNTTISHCSNNYGPFHFPEKLIPLALLNMLHGIAVPIYGDGMQVRDWLHVTDHCRAVDLIIKKGKSGERYNIGGFNGELTNLSLIQKIYFLLKECFSNHPEYHRQYPRSFASFNTPFNEVIEHVTDRLGHDRRYSINSSKLINELHFTYEKDLSQGLKETIIWYLNHQHWWQRLYAESKAVELEGLTAEVE